MVRVCVVGAGTAGVEAAFEASARGAEVTVVERNDSPSPPWESWPQMISAPSSAEDPRSIPWYLGRSLAAPTLTAEAKFARSGSVTTTAGRVDFDFMVQATGSSFEAPSFRGSHKPGVLVLDSAQAYGELGRKSGSMGKIIVAGEGSRCLEVAQRLSGHGREIQVLVSRWRQGRPSPPIFDVLAGSASHQGVSITSGELASAAGTGKVEVVVAGGIVSCCDSVIFVPRRVPRVLPTTSRVSPSGGVLVDWNLRTSDPKEFAAGGCAELESAHPQGTLEGEPFLSGRIAGSNCLGDARSLGPCRTTESLVFGLRWVRMDAREFLPTRVAAVSGRWDRHSACRIRFDSLTKRVLGVELVQPAASLHIAQLPIPLGTDLMSLAYGEVGSSDISVITETARLGLAQCQGS